jgi:hypothetical protein
MAGLNGFVLLEILGANASGLVTGQTHLQCGMITLKARSQTSKWLTTGNFGYHSKITINSSTSLQFASLRMATRKAQSVMNSRIMNSEFANSH